MSQIAMILLLILGLSTIFIVRFRHAFLILIPIFIVLLALQSDFVFELKCASLIWAQIFFLAFSMFITYLSIPEFRKTDRYRIIRLSTAVHTLALFFFLKTFFEKLLSGRQLLVVESEQRVFILNMTQKNYFSSGGDSSRLFVFLYILGLFVFFFIFFNLVRRVKHAS